MCVCVVVLLCVFFLQAEDGIRDLVRSRGLGDVYKRQVYNWEASFYDGRWTGEGTSTEKPRITNGGHNYRMSDYWVEDGSFFRLRSVLLGYSLPRALVSRIGLSLSLIHI